MWKVFLNIVFGFGLLLNTTIGFSSEPVRLGTKIWEPYQVEENGTLGGQSIALLNCVFGKLNRPVEYRVLPWKRTQAMTRSDQLDGFFLGSQAAERDDYAVLSEPLFHQDWAFFYLPDKGKHPSDPDFKQKARIAGIIGSNMTNWVDQEGYRVVMKVPRDDYLYDLLSAGRVDAYVQNHETGISALRRKGIPEDKVRHVTFRQKFLGVYFSKNFLKSNPGFMKDFNGSITKCRLETPHPS